MTSVLVISAHADDETLGCGGTLLRHRHRGDTIDWLLATDARAGGRWSEAEMAKKEEQIELVRGRYGVRHLTRLGHPAGRLDTIAVGELMNGVEQAVANGHPETVYVVHPGDVHTDHRALFAAAASVLKPFHLRNAGVRRVLTYETLSSTEAAPFGAFAPNVYIDVSEWFEAKLEVLALYVTEEQGVHMPRGASAVRALARYRGAAVGVEYAEAMALVHELD